MKKMICENCGSNEFKKIDGYMVCCFCETKYIVTKKDYPIRESKISVNEDIANLLKLCEVDKLNVQKYINLILDIDPTNTDVQKYI